MDSKLSYLAIELSSSHGDLVFFSSLFASGGGTMMTSE